MGWLGRMYGRTLCRRVYRAMTQSEAEALIGRMVRDNDPREPHRIMRINRIEDDYAHLSGYNLKTRVSIKRIFTDGKPRRSGWSLVP